MGHTRLLLTFSLPAMLCAVWTVFAGKDVNWDLLNYHYYLPFELLGGRVGQDFFAASAQSYLNPVGYLPFYLMVSSGWHSVLVSIALAVGHSLALGLLYLVAWRLFAHLPERQRAVMSLLATALGAATSVFWAGVGSSFLDPFLVAPMLAGLLLLLDGAPRASGRALLAGALFGAAAALKYSNAIFALAALPLALAMPGAQGASSRLRAGVAYIIGGALAVAALAGPWLALMMREFGNPVFPLMNAWFRSPYAPAVNLVGERFAPSDFASALALPFRMVALERDVYSETLAPDIRLAALIVAAAALLLAAAARRRAPVGAALQGADARMLAFLSAAAVLWVASSANGRYGMIVLLLSGLALARLLERLLPGPAARIALAVLLLVQLGTSILASPARWFLAEPWSTRWLPYDVPERALREPALYITVEVLPMAVVAPFVHPASSFVNFRGQHSLPADSPKLAALLEQHRGHVRVLGRALELVDGRPREARVRTFDATLLRIGYRVDAGDCFTIAWRPDHDWLSRAANRVAHTQAPEELSVVSCALLGAKRDPADVEMEKQVSALFDRIERSCPGLFRGQTAATERLGGSGWSRNYPGLDARLEALAGRVTLNRHRAMTQADLGALSDWERGQPPLAPSCAGH